MRPLIVIIFALFVAGCLDRTSVPEAPEEQPSIQYQDPGRQIEVQQPQALPREPPAPGERGLDRVPEWRLGEWWHVRVTSELDGMEEEVYRVVAGSEHDNYLVGFPIDAFSNFVMILHHPAYGDIKRSDLSYDTHDSPFQHLRFPLEEGRSWTTTWQAADKTVSAVVTETDVEAGTARIELSGEITGHIVYDASLGEAREMVFEGYGAVEVLDHGFHWEGDVRVPHDHDLVFYHGRQVGVVPVGRSSPPPIMGVAPQPVQPGETIEVDPFFDRLSFSIILIDAVGYLGQTGTTQGVYHQRATAPDGTLFEEELSPADMKAVKLAHFEHEDPAGQWRLSTVTAGPGQALFEGIGYHSIDIRLPGGCVLPSANALHHVTLCTGEEP